VKYVDEFRDPERAQALKRSIAARTTRPWTIMEVCGGQTHAIVKYGIDAMLPNGIELLHGPGCPVCVTALDVIDRAHEIAMRPEVILCSYGDMLRVPGSERDLLACKAAGARIQIVYSPLDALDLAMRSPDREVVFFAVGFETTAPATAMTLDLAKRRGVKNFSVLCAHVLVPPAIVSILQTPGARVQAFLGPGHVCTIEGTRAYEPIASRYGVPIVVTGFEPIDLLAGIARTIELLEEGRAAVDVQYARCVRPEGNPPARALCEKVFEVTDREWRGIGTIPKSGYRLAYEYRDLDAERRFDVAPRRGVESPDCISAQVLRGLARPSDCKAFGTRCTPESPLGATMVSSEGACAAYHAYRKDALVPLGLSR
jgi:hydrogenase expression/formation protein HypD